MHTRDLKPESHLTEMFIFPIDLLDDLIVAIKEFIPWSIHAIHALVGGAFTVLCLMIAITTAKELYDDLKRGWNIELEEEEERIMRQRRIKKNIPKLLLALGGAALGLSMILGGFSHIWTLTGIVVVGAEFFPFAIMATLTVASAISLAKSVADFKDAKAKYNPYDEESVKRYKAARNKVIYDSIDLAACATITACLGIMAFGVLAGVSVMGLGIPLIIIITVAAIAIIAKIIEHRHTFKAGFSYLGNKVGTLFSCHKKVEPNQEQSAAVVSQPVVPNSKAEVEEETGKTSNPNFKGKAVLSGWSLGNPSPVPTPVTQLSNEQPNFG